MCESLMEELTDSGINPDSLTFCCLIVALVNGGKFEEGLQLFNERLKAGEENSVEIVK